MLPYVGITGPSTKDEVEKIAQEFTIAGYNMNSPHVPMLGYLVSYKTLLKQPTENRRYPLVRDLIGMLAQAGKRVMPVIHYNSRERPTLAAQVAGIFDGIYEEDVCRAVQLNIPWPDQRQVGKIMDKFPGMSIVFQLSHNAMDGKTPEQIAKGISEYGSSIDYVLIDPSGGRGIDFDIENSARLYEQIRHKSPRLTVGFAGGFNGGNVAEKVNEIKERIDGNSFCIDAEGGLRDKVTDEYGDDLLNMEKVRAYLSAASQVLP